ncbi:polyadenylate-binding protein 1-like isoform X2 [Ictalurus furcatus]|uniref:polyadenylate-binding protein 1-like isoform X2 n=1 Tax=Ictalurus furcatus TaxID=66913 RepID=UPI002350C6A4|nr:polyadenylate-binding protein 1-like isoform X2 [Ictalurus furcatus]
MSQQIEDIVTEVPSSTPPAPPKLSWSDLMDAEDGGLENVEPFCFYNPWSTKTTSQVEDQKVEEQKEQAKVQQMPVRTKKSPNERLSKNTKSEPSLQGEDIVTEVPSSTPPAPPKPSWGDLMDAEDGGLENVEPFRFYNPWSTKTTSQVEEQKVEEQKEQAKVQLLPVRTRKLPKERLSKNTKTVKLMLRNLDPSVDDRRLHEEFLRFGTVISAKVLMENGFSSGTGTVSYSSPDEARKAILEMNGRLLGSRSVFVTPSQSKEHEGRQRDKTEISRPTEPYPNPHNNIQPQREQGEKQQDNTTSRAQTTLQSMDAQRVELFVKNLDYSVDDRRLHKEFLPFGTIISAKVVPVSH